jgi:hypothetical protein
MMVRKRTQGKTTRKVARKKLTKAAGAKRRMGGAAKKPRARAPKTSPPKPAVPGAVESTRSLDLLRAWSPSRYSTR